MKPTVRFRYASQSRSLYSVVEMPLIIRSPLSYVSSPPIMLSRVVFPEPLGPSTATNSLSRNVTLT